MRHATLPWTLALLVACEATPPAASPDASASDAATDAASALDAGRPDDGAIEADAGDVDAATTDAATTDAAATDAATTDAGPRCAPRPPLGLFVWRDTLVEERDALLDLAVRHGVTEVYLHANLFFAGDAGEASLADWIRAAADRCVEVDLLFGDARWIEPSGQAEAEARTAWALAFAASHPDARPRGVHFDLEPQQLAAWSDAARRGPLVDALASLLERMTPRAEAGGLSLTLDVGFFLDGVDVTRGGVTRPGHAWLTDAVSRLVVMDYRDSAESTGFGGMISLAETEVAYATSVGTPVVLAAETRAVSPEYVSFREEGLAAMERELGLVRARFEREPAFAGVAVHDETGLAELGP